MHRFVESFDSYYENRYDNLQILVEDLLNSKYLPSYMSEASSDDDGDNDSNIKIVIL